MEKKIGDYSFIIGVIVAVVLGIAAPALGSSAVLWLTTLLILAGIAIGFLNVSGKETKDFLLVAVSLVIVSYVATATGNNYLGNVQVIGAYLQGIFNSILSIVVPATIVVALRAIYSLAHET